jgi:PAS domain S-box-containing protein
MPPPIRILMVEDSHEDAHLITLHLEAHGLAFTSLRVDSLEGFLAALRAGPWDLVLSDYSLPGTDGMEILKCLRDLDPDLPFILLSGVLNEGAAVAAMRAGANDFLLKGSLSRLVPAIEREMKETELRRKQRAFEEELRLLHTAIGQTPDVVLITDPEGVILYANAAAMAISGFQRDELLGQNPRLFKSDLHDVAFYRTMWEALLRGETWKSHIVNRRKDGTLWDAETVIAPVYGLQGELQNYLCTARDSTLERQLQGFLEQSQRLETIGTLTAGIAHDFNNILMPVLGHAELGMGREPGDLAVKHDLEVIQVSAHRARDLIRQILAFSRQGVGELVPIDFQSLLVESLKLLRATLPTSISFDQDLQAQGGHVLGDPTKVHQVILNLCTNAGHAMRGTAGHLTVRLSAGHWPATPCLMNILLAEGEYLCLEVADTGKGIASEHLEKIFLPFFTTKPATEGSGLGLSVTHGIVSSMGGGILVRSQVGVGTSFKVLLPLHSASVSPKQEADAPHPRGQGQILLVDDEAPLLEMLHTSLVRMGFQVSSFCEPRAALQAFLKEPSAFQVLVTDHIMPNLSGLQLAEALWAARPSLPAILLSGQPGLDQAGAGMLQAGFRACLTKPMSPSDLAKAILRVVPDMKGSSPIVQP